MARIMVYNGNDCVAITTKAYDCLVTKELMRAHFLQFALVNNNPARKYIAPGVVFEIGGEQFDISQFHKESGKENFTDVTAVHVSYRLNKYILPPGYSALGTPRQIAQDILDTAVDGNGTPTSSEFTLGTVRDSGPVAFNLGNEQEVTVRSAMLGLQAIGVEVDYSNFIINLPERVGTETGKVFRFGRDLVNLRRTWNKNDGSTYEIDVAALYRMPGGRPEDAFDVGDTVTIEDGYTGEAIQRRIIAYAQDPDNPLNDKVTLGVFIRDNTTNSINMRTDINTKLTEGAKYNNVSINRTEGFVAESSDGQYKSTHGGEDAFACWVQEGSEWVKKSRLSAIGLEASAISDLNSPVYGRIGEYSDGLSTWRGIQLRRRSDNQILLSMYVIDGGSVILSPSGDINDGFLFLLGNGSVTLGQFGHSRVMLSDDYGVEFEKAGAPHGVSITKNGFIVTNGIITGTY